MPFKSFIEYLLLEKNYSKLTVKAYEADLYSFYEFVQNEYNLESLHRVNYAQIRTWIVLMVENNISNRSINRKISALNSYYKFLLKIKEIEANPLVKHKALKTSKKVQIPFSEKEVFSVLDDIKYDKNFEGIRNRLIIELFYTTGMRRIELIDLKVASFNVVNRSVKVLGKRKKERIIPLLKDTIELFHLYIIERNKIERIKDADYLFLTKKGVKIYETLVYRIINDYFSLASTKVKKSPHILRHSFATHLLNQGANINAVKELLGHSSLSATQVYTHNSIAELKKVHINSHPRSKK